MIYNSPLSVVRAIAHQLKLLNGVDMVSKNPAIRAILDELRKHDVTDERTCRAQRELLFMANTYAKYLESVVKYRELSEIYGKGETTVEEAANRVGLKLPETKH